MKKRFESKWLERFADGAARAFFVAAWSDEQEEKGKRFRQGVDLMDQAPATPLSAYVHAGILIGQLEVLNKASIYMIGERAAEADGVPEIDSQELGHYLAMEAMGHGVSWSDDHKDFPIKVPYLEYHFG